jgi:hypothetical protein
VHFGRFLTVPQRYKEKVMNAGGIRQALELLADKLDEALTQRGEIPHVTTARGADGKEYPRQEGGYSRHSTISPRPTFFTASGR